jgi:chromosome segregation ATPase
MENIFQMLKALREDVAGIKAAVTALQSDVTAVKDVQHKQDNRLEALHTDVKDQGKRLTALEAGQIALDLKVEAIHDYQKKAHTEIMGHLLDTTGMSDRDHEALEKRVTRIEKHLNLPPGK